MGTPSHHLRELNWLDSEDLKEQYPHRADVPEAWLYRSARLLDALCELADAAPAGTAGMDAEYLQELATQARAQAVRWWDKMGI